MRYGMRDTGCEMRDRGWGMGDRGYEMRSEVSGIAYLISRIPDLLSPFPLFAPVSPVARFYLAGAWIERRSHSATPERPI